MSELTSMMNIGKEMERKLISIGIDSSEKLIALGSKQAFCKTKTGISSSLPGAFVHSGGRNSKH